MDTVSWILIVFVAGLILVEWDFERRRSGKLEATVKILFGALMFLFFYGIWIKVWSLSVLAMGVLAILWLKKRLGLVVATCVMLVMVVSYLAFRYSPWFFALDLVVIVVQWFWSKRVIDNEAQK